MSNYLIELSVIHTALILGYWFFLRRERQYAKMRFYLIASTLLALAIPLLKLPKLLFTGKETVDAVMLEAIPMETMMITSSADTSSWVNDLLVGVYIAITAFFLFKFLSGVFYLMWLERRSIYEEINDLRIRKVNDIKGSFTFFNWIFLSSEIDPHREDYEMILKHEKAHVSLGHTYDLMFFELFKVSFWWLPTAWIITKEIKKIHEYQADAAALKSCDVDQYSSILISSTLKTNGLSLASSFHDGLILKRLTAMKQQAKNVSPWKLGALSALCVLLVMVFACSEDVDRQIKEIGSKSNAITFDQLPTSMQADLAKVKDELSFLKVDVSEDDEISQIKVNVSGDNVISDIKELQDLDPNLIHAINVDKINKAIYIALKKDGANFDNLSEKSKLSRSEGDVFTIVEAHPEFEGGINGFRSYIAKEIRYPLQARQAGVEGVVDVQFVVEKDGSLSEVKAIKGIGSGCDEEAVRVLRNSPRFKPATQNGKPVRVRMVVPITFKLNEGKTNPDKSTQGIVIIEEVQSQNEKFKVDADYANGEWSGTVYDEEGNPLPGVNILVVGTSTGTVSGMDGSFQLKADQSNDLALSFIGYESVKLKGR